MELFVVRNRTSHEVLKGKFNNKMDAKKFRDAQNGPITEDNPPKYVVSYGKDHDKFRGKNK